MACTFSTSERQKVVRTPQFFTLLTWACNFSTSQLPKVVRAWCVLYILTWKCASRYSGVRFFDISSSKSAPNLACFVHFWVGNVLRATTACNFSISHLASDPPEPQIIGKAQWVATFLPFCAPASSFFSFFLFPVLLTSFLLLSDSSHLCFSICPYCRKLPSITQLLARLSPWLGIGNISAW